jgi:50S ribosomal subunit-associated GTPase HflX
MLQDGSKGVYRTIVTNNNQTSELIVEVKELAVTKGGKVKVEFISANYKNPDFRTLIGEELLHEVRNLLGDYLHTEVTLQKQHFGA